MEAVMWFDYVCPWAYLGRDRTAIMRDLGVDVTLRPFELHPEIPRDGAPVRPGGRLAEVFALIGAECAELGIPFEAPAVNRNSRRALETAEVVRALEPEAFGPFDEAVSAAYWVEGRDIADAATLDELVAGHGLDPAAVRDGLLDGIGARALEASMREARDRGVTATPSWWVNDALLIPGAQPRDSVRRWVSKLLARSAAG